MALVSGFERSPKDRQSVHRPTRCLYAIISDDEGGRRYLQLDTVGSIDREIPDKVSQSIQFDRAGAGQLLKILCEAFPDLMDGVESGKKEEDDSDRDEEEAVEGRLLLKLHRIRERDRRIARRKKQTVLSAEDRLQCEVCGFDFALAFGALGEGFAECHHRVPLAMLDGTKSTKLTDLAIVCANCHRMLHRPPFLTVEQLRDLVNKHNLSRSRPVRRQP